jgi:hypothetical protein
MNGSETEAHYVGVHLLEKVMDPPKNHRLVPDHPVHAADDRHPAGWAWRQPVVQLYFHGGGCCFVSVEEKR